LRQKGALGFSEVTRQNRFVEQPLKFVIRFKYVFREISGQQQLEYFNATVTNPNNVFFYTTSEFSYVIFLLEHYRTENYPVCSKNLAFIFSS